MRLLTVLTLLVSLFAALAMAADVTGAWKAQVPGRDGQTREMTLTFKVDGATLTGSISSPGGEIAISDGKISGDDISFTVVRKFGDNEVKVLYKGKVSGDTIKFTSQREGAERVTEFVAKKA
jgi:hypothetical protein